jgi:hypothetical protein
LSCHLRSHPRHPNPPHPPFSRQSLRPLLLRLPLLLLLPLPKKKRKTIAAAGAIVMAVTTAETVIGDVVTDVAMATDVAAAAATEHAE